MMATKRIQEEQTVDTMLTYLVDLCNLRSMADSQVLPGDTENLM